MSPDTSYSFTVTAIDSEGNESDAYATKLTFKTQNEVSTREVSGTSVSILPVPAKDVITINGIGISASVEIMNVQGSIVLQAVNQNVIDISGLNAGLYLIRIADKTANQYLEKLLVK